MSTAPSSKPAGYHSITPYLIVNDAASAIVFYQKAFGAVETVRMAFGGAKGASRIGHAELRIGDSCVMLADECPEMHIRSARTIGGSPVSLLLYVDDVDAVVARAISSGASIQQPVDNKFYGDRSGMLKDPFGHTWTIATHVEDVAPEEMRRRAEAFMKQSS